MNTRLRRVVVPHPRRGICLLGGVADTLSGMTLAPHPFLEDYERELGKIIQQEELDCLADFESMRFDGKDAKAFSSLIQKTREATNGDGTFDALIDDILSAASSIQFSLANVFLYCPLANNFLEEMSTDRSGRSIPTYFKKREDARFFFYVNTTFEKLYVFWDRIGKLLDLGFLLQQRNTYFDKTLRNIDKKGQFDSAAWSWLQLFLEREYREVLNRLRVRVVHHQQKETYFLHAWIGAVGQRNNLDIEALQREKDALPGLLKHQLACTSQGFEACVRFISDYGHFEI